MELPKGYESWLSLYIRLKEGIKFLDGFDKDHHIRVVKYGTYEVKDIKSKALDEVIENLPSKQDVYWAIRALESSDDVSRRTIDTFEKLMEICTGSN